MNSTLSANPKILITRADRIGDLMISTSVFPEIRKKFPGAKIALLTFPENRELVEGNPFLDEVLLYDKKGSEKGWLGHFLFSRKLAAKKFDLVIHLHATNRMHQLTWMAGIPIRIGWDRRAHWALTHVLKDIKKQGLKHEGEYNFELLQLLGISCPEKLETYFPISNQAERSLEMLLKHLQIPTALPWIVLNPGASCPSKRWPAERFSRVANAIHQRYPGFIFIGIGSLADRPMLQKICEEIRAPFYDLSGQLSLGMLGVLLKQSRLLISNDSGPAHIAAAVGTPVISIFGRNQGGLSATRWRPLGEKSVYVWKNVGCDPCLAHACRIHFLCLDVISPELIVETAEPFLS